MDHHIASGHRAAAEARYGQVARQPRYGIIRRLLAAVGAMCIVGFSATMFNLIFHPSLAEIGAWIGLMFGILMLPAASKLARIAFKGE